MNEPAGVVVSLLVVHALPGLEIEGRVRLPTWSRHLRFDPAGNPLFTTLGRRGLEEVVAANAATSALRNVAQAPDSDVHDFVYTHDGGAFVVTRKIRFDLSSQDGRGRLSRLTSDGRSVNGSLSPTGMLAIQRVLPDGREVIALRDDKGEETVATAGPKDLAPSFMPDGRSWIHVSYANGEIVECSVETKRCHLVHRDPLLPAYPVADPSGQRIAYITALNASRIRVITRTSGAAGQATDLGPAVGCGPVWTSTDRLWIVTSASAREKIWAELDVASARRTGRTRVAPSAPGSVECLFPRDPQGAPQSDRVVPTVTEESNLTFVAAPSPS